MKALVSHLAGTVNLPTKSALRATKYLTGDFDAAKQELISRSAKLAYPIRDGIPIMLPEEARKIE